MTNDREKPRDSFGALWNTWSGAASVLGAFALLDMVESFVELKQGLRDLLAAWSAVVSPISEAMFGWIRYVIPLHLPDWLDDYLMLGVIAGTAAARAVWISMRAINSQRALYLPKLRAAQQRALRSKNMSAFPSPESLFAWLALTNDMDLSALRKSHPVKEDVDALEAIRDADAPVQPVAATFKLVRDVFARLTESEIAMYRRLTPASFSLVEALAYWPLLPIWPLVFAWFGYRVRVLARGRFFTFIAHAFGFVIVAMMFVAASYAFFWLE